MGLLEALANPSYEARRLLAMAAGGGRAEGWAAVLTTLPGRIGHGAVVELQRLAATVAREVQHVRRFDTAVNGLRWRSDRQSQTSRPGGSSTPTTIDRYPPSLTQSAPSSGYSSTGRRE